MGGSLKWKRRENSYAKSMQVSPNFAGAALYSNYRMMELKYTEFRIQTIERGKLYSMMTDKQVITHSRYRS